MALVTFLRATTVILNQLDEDRWSPTVPGRTERELRTTDATRVCAPERSAAPAAVCAATCGGGSGRELLEQSDGAGAVGLVRRESSQSVTVSLRAGELKVLPLEKRGEVERGSAGCQKANWERVCLRGGQNTEPSVAEAGLPCPWRPGAVRSRFLCVDSAQEKSGMWGAGLVSF